MNVLVVEDDAEMAELLVRGLREEAHEVDLARDGRTALALSNGGSFDVILLDVMLPGMDGLKVARELRLRREQVPVLMLTARDAFSDIVKGLDAGADDCLAAPFHLAELRARMRAVSRHRTPLTRHLRDHPATLGGHR